jgi:hypothetical protein
MELKEVVEWVDARLNALDLSDTRAEKKARAPSAIQNMRKTLRNGYGSLPKVGTLRALAKVLGDPPPGLFEPLAPLGAKPVSESSDDAVARLLEQQRFYREKEQEFKALADAIDVSLAILERKKTG